MIRLKTEDQFINIIPPLYQLTGETRDFVPSIKMSETQPRQDCAHTITVLLCRSSKQTHTHTLTHQHTHSKLSSFHLVKWAVVIDLWICSLFFSLHLSEIMYGSNLATDISENLFEIISAEAVAVCLLRGEEQSIIVCSLVKHSITAITLDWAYSQPVPWPLEDRAVNVPFYFRGYVTCFADLYYDTAILSKQMDNGVTSKKPCLYWV